MKDDDFEWDPIKARRNRRKHGVAFDTAKKAFADPFMVEILDDREEYGEERYLSLAWSMANCSAPSMPNGTDVFV